MFIINFIKRRRRRKKKTAGKGILVCLPVLQERSWFLPPPPNFCLLSPPLPCSPTPLPRTAEGNGGQRSFPACWTPEVQTWTEGTGSFCGDLVWVAEPERQKERTELQKIRPHSSFIPQNVHFMSLGLHWMLLGYQRDTPKRVGRTNAPSS